MADKNSPQLNIPPNASDLDRAKAYSDYFGIPLVGLKGKEIPIGVLSKIPYEVSKTFDIIAYDYNDQTPIPVLKIAVGDAAKLQKKAPAILSELKKNKGLNIELAITTREDFDYLLNYYKKLSDGKNKEDTANEPNQETVSNGNISKNEFPLVDLRQKAISFNILTKFPEEVALRYNLIVFDAPNDQSIKVAAVNPRDKKVQDILNFVKNKNKIEINLFETSQPSMDWALRGYQNKPKPIPKELSSTANVEKTEEEPEESLSQNNAKIPSEIEESAKSMEANKVPQVAPNVPSVTNVSSIPKVPVASIAKDENSSEKSDRFDKNRVIPNVKISEISQSVVQNPTEKGTNTSLRAEESENNLDKIIPEGVNNSTELENIIKSGFIPKTLASIVFMAIIEGASDIHLEGDNKDLKLRYRIDGILRDILKMPLELQAPLVSRIKILSKLKIDETRIPQDGRFEVIVNGKDVDLRVSTLPTIHGEKAVLRILDKSSQLLSIEQVGLSGNGLKILERNIRKPFGIILATGPTGSGKTTSLYSIINKINRPEINVVTLEDPVEYEIPNVNQCQIKPKIGFGFADGLRSILRQDPNIIMVGEIRDQETASMATHAALTGHLVLTTLHTNDTASALPRLINMGVEPFLITSAINIIIAQRLVRRICPDCKEEYDIPPAIKNEIKEMIDKSMNQELAEFKGKELKFHRGKGCSKCSEGFRGRIGIFEILEMSSKIEDLAVLRSPATTIKEEAIREGMLTIKQDGIIKVLKGITTIDEILRVTSQ